MAKASRSKQPAFDPQELEDLIFSPAVGTGVSSHLLEKVERFPAPPSTVDMSSGASEVSSQLRSRKVTNLKVLTQQTSDLPTVATSAVSTVDTCEPPVADLTTVVMAEMPTVDRFEHSLPAYSKKVPLWITEQGDLIPQGRVKRIRLAQDVINSAEESVYDTLWTGKGSVDNEASRVVQAGYDYLAKRTRLARKTIQRIVAKLIDKDFIEIERPADIYQRTSTVYRVFSYKAVLERHVQRDRTHVAKLGPGFSYVKPLDMSTVVNSDMSTVVNEAPVTVVGMDLSTVVRESTPSIGNKVLEQTTSAAREALSAYGNVDDDAVTRLIRSCKEQMPDCTEDEIIHFIHQKGRLVKARESRIQNPIGFLIDAVPKCFSSEAFRTWRLAGRDEPPATNTDADQKERDRAWGREHEAELNDPGVPETVKRVIRECLRLPQTSEL